ncbi:hypothetical protein [Nocardia acidivorans]|uniref:hypothetical protein n=1 Tax=Nocardia acidivorans TaxID=404580 RepID=UPI00082DB3E8|nr:hypothetical protein [Nocardia acidivorans]
MIHNSTATVIEMVATPEHKAYGNPGHMHESVVELRGNFRHQGRNSRYLVIYLDDEAVTRREHGGPMVKGEYAYMLALPTVISNRPAPVVRVIDVKDGDEISILGRVFRIQDDRRGYDPRLIRVEN